VKSYGVWLEEFFAYLIIEMKNEPAGLGGDQFLQGLIVYNGILPQEKILSSSSPLHPTEIHGDKQIHRVASWTVIGITKQASTWSHQPRQNPTADPLKGSMNLDSPLKWKSRTITEPLRGPWINFLVACVAN